MITWFAFMLPFALAIAAERIAHAPSSNDARHKATLVMAGACVVALAWPVLRQPVIGLSTLPEPTGSPEVAGIHTMVPLVTCVIGLVAVAVTPAITTHASTFARMLVLIALALCVPLVRHPLAIAALWSLSAVVAWLELHREPRNAASARLFALYHVPSVCLVMIGAVLHARGEASLAVLPIVLGIAIREAIVPVQSWFPNFVEHAPLGTVVAFSAPQLGVYMHLELLSPVISHELAHEVAVVGAITAVVAAALGLAQRNARRSLAYLIMSQGGLVAFGLENHSVVAHAGTLLTWQAVALASAGLSMTLAAIEARRGRLTLDVPSGSFARTPNLAVAFLLLGFASVGLPLTPGFVAEDLLVSGSVGEFPTLGFALIVATALNGMNVMRSFFVLFSGTSRHSGEVDLITREFVALTATIAILLVGGVVPVIWFLR